LSYKSIRTPNKNSQSKTKNKKIMQQQHLSILIANTKN